MLSKKVEAILNEQIKREAYSSNLYLAMASWSENKGFSGISDWFYAQAEEEKMHMLKFIHYINERGGYATIPALDKPPTDYKDTTNIFNEVLKHEQYISASINKIVGLCIDEKDFTTHSWIQWFVNEQIEEEAGVQNIVDKLKLVGEHNLYIFDRDIMGLRKQAANANL